MAKAGTNLTKTCTKCKQEFPATLEYFYKKTKDRLHSICKKCHVKQTRPNRKTYLERNPKMKWTQKDKNRQRNKRLEKIGFTAELFDEMFEAQGRVCILCGSDQPGATNWNADHDHKTNKPRGVLCWSCNTTLGHIEKRDYDWVFRARKYIDEGGFYKKHDQT
jgi:hypothetical protein